MIKKLSEAIGVCQYCIEEYEENQPPSVKLYRYNNKLLCGGCASELKGDAEFYTMAYGDD